MKTLIIAINPNGDGRATLAELAKLTDKGGTEIFYREVPALAPADIVRQAMFLISRDRPDVVFLPSPEFVGGLTGQIQERVRLVIGIDCITRAAAITEAVRFADGIQVPTQCWLDQIVGGIVAARYPSLQQAIRDSRDRTRVLPYGVRAAFTTMSGSDADIRQRKASAASAVRGELHLADRPLPIIAVVARNCQQKRLDVSLSAIRVAVDAGRAQAIVRIISREPPSAATCPHIDEFARFAVVHSNDISLGIGTSSPRGRELVRMLEATDVVAFPSDPGAEPAGIHPIEGLGCGAVVIGRRCGNLADLADSVYRGHEHLLVDASEDNLASVFAEQLSQLCTDILAGCPRADELRRRGLAAANSLKWQALLPRYLEFFAGEPSQT